MNNLNLNTTIEKQPMASNSNTVQIDDGSFIVFNPEYKLTRKQSKELKRRLYIGAGLQFKGKEVTFSNPEQFMDNIEMQKEVLVAMYWNSPEYWQNPSNETNLWTSRPTDQINSDIFDKMYDQVADLDPLRTKKLEERATHDSK